MYLIGCSPKEYCLNGTRKYELVFNSMWGFTQIQHLRYHAKLDYYTSFNHPFFRAVFPNGFILKGLEGETTCTAFSAEEEVETNLQLIESIFSYSKDDYTKTKINNANKDGGKNGG